MEKLLTKTKPAYLAVIFLLSMIMLLPLFDEELFLIPAGLIAVVFAITALLKPEIPLYLMFLFIFAGTLFSVPAGFTLKASQVFSVLALTAFIIRFLHSGRELKFTVLKQYLPFILFFMAVVPSLVMPGLAKGHEGYETSIRLVFNYLFLQLILLAIITGVQTRTDLKKALFLCLLSFTWVLIFGFFQQFGYYMGFYDPYQYVSVHSTFVDFYGPLLRFSPGTFANEFGEITQSVAIALTAFLVFMKNSFNRKSYLVLVFILVLSLTALFLNFTRISWLVYAFFLVVLFIYMKGIKSRLKFMTLALLSAFTFYLINLKTDFLFLLQFLSRFNELTSITEYSAGARLESLHESFYYFLQSPMIGNGWGLFPETHNVPVQLLAETGLLGFLAFYSLSAYLFYKFIKMYKAADDKFLKTVSFVVISVFSGCLIFDLTNHGIFHFILWLAIGLGISTEKIVLNEKL